MVSQIHPIPPYDNVTVFEEVLNRTVELGLYLIYDMRSCVVVLGLNLLCLSYRCVICRSYQNLTEVAQLVKTYSSLPNLLLWETAHEPDGNSDPFTAAQSAYDLIYELDGYHPVSIVLNCQVGFPQLRTCVHDLISDRRTITFRPMSRVRTLCSRTPTRLASTPHGRLFTTPRAPRTLAIAGVTTARDTCTTSRHGSRPSRTGSTSLGMTAARRSGRHLKHLASVPRE